MPKSLSDTHQRVRESYHRVQEAVRKDNVPYAIDLLLTILEMEPELDEQRKELRELQMGQLKKKKANPLSSVTGMGKLMAVKSAIKKTPEKALPAAEELMKVDPLNSSFMETYEEAAKAAEYPQAAAILYREVLKVDKSNEDLWERLGKLYLEMGEASQANDAFIRLGDLKPNDQQVIKWIKDTSAMDSMTKGGWEQEGDFRNKLKDESEASELEQAGRSQQKLSDMDRLITNQRKRLEAEPENLNLYRPLADSLVKAGQLQEGLDVLYQADEKANHADPMIQRAISETTVKIYDHNIKVLREEGDEDGAKEQEEEKQKFLLEDIADKVKRYPNDLAFKFDYGELLYAQGKMDEAIGQFQQAQRNPKRRVDALYLMGRCFKAKGQYDIAAGQLQKASEEVPTMDEQKMAILYELGEVLEAQGDFQTALNHFKQIYAVDIGYKDVAKKIEAGYARSKKEEDA